MNKEKDALSVVSFIVAAIVILIVLGVLTKYAPGTAEVQMGLIIVLAISALMVLMFIMAAGFARLNLTDPRQALALPEGSVRAMIALFLIMVFIIFGIYLFRTVAVPRETTTLPGLTAAQIAELPVENVVSVVERETEPETFDVEIRVGDDVTTTLTGLTAAQIVELPVENVVSVVKREAEPETFDVEIRVDISEAGARLAQQLITTVGTLVVAIAGFYFGTRAVAAARGVAVPSLPVIRNMDPNKGKQGKVLPVTISGRNFESPKVVRLVRGSEEMVGTDIMSSATEIHCKIVVDKKPDGKWDLIVVNEDGGEDRLAEAFTVTPIVTSITPATGEVAKGSVDVTIAGAGFAEGAEVKLRQADQPDIVASKVKVVSDKQIKCTFDLTGKTPGKWDVVVTNPDKTEGKADAAFEVT